ncbi:MAG TPA: pyruvate kinase, partial [Clostridia bacterium]|nr:pyruvate kinase [Clostridia bacterium]
MRHSKIVCTLGPASETVAVLKEMIIAGMNVARLNLSHGSLPEHERRIRNVRQAAQETGINVAILLDTKGPEIRIGDLEENINLKEGQKLVLTTEDVLGSRERIPVRYPGLARDVKPGTKILIDDGLIELVVERVMDTEIFCSVENPGELSGGKGVNVPGALINLPAVTAKDRQDILFGISLQVDFIAGSFIRSASDVLDIRRILEENQGDIQVIAKIENRSGVDNIDEILEVADGIMVARGDLGVEIPAEEVPLLQKRIIEKCNLLGKPVITATQMLDSMIRNPRPTRAEASDVANAIFDGTDAIMLSGETAIGKYPVEAVKTMARIAEKTEDALPDQNFRNDSLLTRTSITGSIGHATHTVARELGAVAIITPTTSGSTTRMVSRYRPRAPIVAATPDARVLRQLLLVWGARPVLVKKMEGTDAMIAEAVQAALRINIISPGDLVVITAGVPVGVPGTTNLLKVHVVGEVVVKGQGIGRSVVTGPVRLCKKGDEALEKILPGDILVTYGTDRDFIKAMEKAAAIITVEGGLTSHGAVVGLSLGIP